MPQNKLSTAATKATIAKLGAKPHLGEFNPIAARMVHAIRLIALHEQAKRDPVPELAQRLGHIDVAVKALSLAQAICASWPENIQVSRFCCGFLSHDEMTVAAMVDCAGHRDRDAFARTVQGLVRPERIPRLWDATLALVETEYRAATHS